MNIETILPPLGLLNRRRKKWVYPGSTSYSIKKSLTSEFGTAIAEHDVSKILDWLVQ